MVKKRILLAEDEPKLASSVKSELERNEFEVMLAYDGQIASHWLENEKFDVILLDLNLPLMNGFELCKRARQTNTNVPIIILTAFSDIDSKMNAFSLGADDYIVKPFHLNELLAKIRVFLRRSESNQGISPQISISDLIIFTEEKKVTRAGNEIHLSAREYQLLEYLALRKGRVASKVEIAEKVWDIGFETGTNTIEVYISFLRNKIDAGHNSKLIHTKPGFGYFLQDPNET
jgi:two-component system, OmpR family, copper resistance phosphate regulon response regulator CusR